jgi:hypothetical protein
MVSIQMRQKKAHRKVGFFSSACPAAVRQVGLSAVKLHIKQFGNRIRPNLLSHGLQMKSWAKYDQAQYCKH